MGNFFTSTQIYNNRKLNREKYIEYFCKEMAEEGYIACDGDECELSYILRFADNCKWVTITSEAYEEGNEISKKDTSRLAKMLGTTCVNTVVIDSDCAILELYDKSGEKADMLTIGRADDYFDDDIPHPSEKIWKSFLSENSSWEQFMEICNCDEVFVEDELQKLAPIIGMDVCNITFAAEDADECDQNTVFLDFKKARSAITMSQGGKTIEIPNQKITINAAFNQIFGEALKPFGFKVIKGRHPYFVRVINNEILHIITFYPTDPEYPPDKAISIVGGVATIYRKRISFDKSPKQNHEWLAYASSFYASSFNEPDRRIMSLLYKACYYSDSTESMITVLKVGAENVIKFVLPVLDKVKDIDSCLDYLDKFKMPRSQKQCTKIYTYYPDADEGFLNFISDKRISERPDFLENYFNDSEFHKWVLNEIEERKKNNTEILKSYGIFSETLNEKKLTLKEVFIDVFGKALEPHGYKKVKGAKPYFVRVIDNEIIHIITIIRNKGALRGRVKFDIQGDVFSVYNRYFDLNVKLEDGYLLLSNFRVYSYKMHEKDYDSNIQCELYQFECNDDNASIINEMKNAFDTCEKWLFPFINSLGNIEKYFMFLVLRRPSSIESKNELLYLDVDKYAELITEVCRIKNEMYRKCIELNREGYTEEEYEKRLKRGEKFYSKWINDIKEIREQNELYNEYKADKEAVKEKNMEILKKYIII